MVYSESLLKQDRMAISCSPSVCDEWSNIYCSILCLCSNDLLQQPLSDARSWTWQSDGRLSLLIPYSVKIFGDFFQVGKSNLFESQEIRFNWRANLLFMDMEVLKEELKMWCSHLFYQLSTRIPLESCFCLSIEEMKEEQWSTKAKRDVYLRRSKYWNSFKLDSGYGSNVKR